METLQRQVRRARRRLTAERFLDVLGWCWFAALTVALLLIIADKIWPLGVEPWGWAAGAMAVGLVVALVWAMLARRGLIEAAIEIDHRFALKERVSSAMSLTPADRQTEAGEALVADAVRRVERIDVAGRFTVKPSRRLLLPLLPGLLAVLVAMLISPAVEKQALAESPEPAAKEQIKKSTESVRRQLEKRRELAKKEGLPEAERVFKKIEQGLKDLNKEPTKEKALVKLNDLARIAAERRKQLGGADKIKQQLDQMRKIDQGPADKLADAVRKGDFKKALDELNKLQNQLANNKLNDKQRADLAKQLDQMKDKLNKLAEAQQAAQRDLKKQAEQARQAGRMAEANKLEEQLAQLQQQAPQMQQMKQMAKQCGQCSKCLKQGQQGQAAKAMAQMQQDLKSLQKQLDEMGMLDEQMEQLAKAREQMTCKKCGGAGCAMCQGIPGDGLGQGRGAGARPEQKTNTRFYDSHAKQKIGEGAAILAGTVDGQNIRGNVRQQIQQQVTEATRQGAADPVSGRHLPKKRGDQAKEYFNEWREGK
ncbi:MAG: hypothetical protein ABFC96_02995 [Thermoguttaceae bacterium]